MTHFILLEAAGASPPSGSLPVPLRLAPRLSSVLPQCSVFSPLYHSADWNEISSFISSFHRSSVSGCVGLDAGIKPKKQSSCFNGGHALEGGGSDNTYMYNI